MHSEQSQAAGRFDEASVVFVGLRPRLFGIAYRMLGSWSEAEDIVQEVWLRWQTTDRTIVVNPSAFLATITTRLAINVARSAHSRRETYIGPWLPEPIDTSIDPAVGAERGEALELAVLLLLEKLTPTERAAYVLREAFDYPYGQIADVLQLEEANARQLVRRARKHLATERQAPVGVVEHRRLLESFLAAAQTGNLVALEELFASEVVSYSDGGGLREVARMPVLGRTRVARFVGAFAHRFWPDTRIEWVEANGRAGVLVLRDETAIALLTMDASAQGITQVLWVMSPTKLAGFSRSLTRLRQEPHLAGGDPSSS